MDHEHFGLQKEDIRAKGRDLGQRDPRRMRAKAKDCHTMAVLKTLANTGSRGGKARVVDNPQAIYLDFERLGKIGFHPIPDPDDPEKNLIQPTPGNEWEVFYQAAQKLAPVMLFCISRRWNASQWCHQELARYKELHDVTRPAQIADAFFLFFDKTEDETAPGAVHDQWDALVDGCCYLSDEEAGHERQHNPRQMGFWGECLDCSRIVWNNTCSHVGRAAIPPARKDLGSGPTHLKLNAPGAGLGRKGRCSPAPSCVRPRSPAQQRHGAVRLQ